MGLMTSLTLGDNNQAQRDREEKTQALIAEQSRRVKMMEERVSEQSKSCPNCSGDPDPGHPNPAQIAEVRSPLAVVRTDLEPSSPAASR